MDYIRREGESERYWVDAQIVERRIREEIEKERRRRE
jgi:hypothetical protein